MFSIAVVFYISTNNVWGFQFFHILTITYFLFFFIIIIASSGCEMMS